MFGHELDSGRETVWVGVLLIASFGLQSTFKSTFKCNYNLYFKLLPHFERSNDNLHSVCESLTTLGCVPLRRQMIHQWGKLTTSHKCFAKA